MRNSIHTFTFVLLLFVAAHVNAAISGLYVFGDSLSDSGNAFTFLSAVLLDPNPNEPTPWVNAVPGKPYAPSNNFSNGPVWVNYVADDLGVGLIPSLAGGTNYAFGGARTGTLDFGGTIEMDPTSVAGQAFSAAGSALPGDALYIVNGGGNDVRSGSELVGLGTVTPAVAIATMSQGAANLAGAIGDLALAGATQFIVSNVPDVGRAPALVALGPTAAGFATTLVNAFNAALVTELSDLVAANPLLDIITIDSFTLLNDLLDNPGTFGFSNAIDACTLQNAGTGCADPSSYVFWDGIHPTTAAHRLSADAALAALVPLPAAAWMFASALGLLFGARRRRMTTA